MAHLRWVPLVVTVVLSVGYVYLGVQPRTPDLLRRVPDVAAHAGAYAVLGCSATLVGRVLALARPAIWGAAYATAHGAALEGLQEISPRRRAQWRDLLADAVGAVLGALVARRLRLFTPRETA